MWIRLVCAPVMMCLVSLSAEAQDGLRSAVLPEPTLNSNGSAEPDLFRVPPDFYNRPPDPGSSRLFFPYFLPALPPTPDWYFHRYRPIPVPPQTRRSREALPAVTAIPSPSLPPIPPGQPKTFYVIPGCYAGDKPPEPGWLPSGCDISKLRAIPPA
jgi:hypothetical protein